MAELVRIAPICNGQHNIRDNHKASYILAMPDQNLTDADRAGAGACKRWKGRMTKLDPTAQNAAEPYPPAKAWVNSSIGQRKRRR